MSIRIFTKEQVEELVNNPFITMCSNKSVTFSKEFKIDAIRQYEEEFLSPQEIFTNAGFNIDVIGKEQPRRCLSRWKNINKLRGPTGFLESRGKNTLKRKSKIIDSSDTDKIKRLEAEVAYLRSENDFLAKLRAKRAE